MTAADVITFLRAHPCVLPVGGGTKPALSTPPPGCTALPLHALTGIVEYDPGEYTLTALAGTPLRDVIAALGAHGQHLPFDPPFADAGATLGGVVASGLSGPGRQRYGGVRDFILGVRFVTGAGELVRGGGKVVKNAAGFDLPKLLVGSLGRLGVITEVTFKVFPAPRATATLRADFPDLPAALAALARLGASPFDLEALELDPPGALTLRVGGPADTIAARLAALKKFLAVPATRLADNFPLAPTLPADPAALLAKIPLTLAALPALDPALAAAGATRRYSSAANLLWLTWPGPATALDTLLRAHALAALVLSGATPGPLLGALRGENFRARLKTALDPENRFPNF